MKKFKVVQCPNCGSVQSSQTTIIFKCFRCGRSKTVNPKSRLGFGIKILESFDTGDEAAKFVQEYQKQIWENKKREV